MSFILDVLGEKRQKIICIDELDKMPREVAQFHGNWTHSESVSLDKHPPIRPPTIPHS